MPRAVSGSKRVGGLKRDRQCAFQRQWTSIDQLAHVTTLDVLHRDEVNAVDLVEIEDRADVWMIEGRGETGFAFETFEVGFLGGEFCGKDFDDNGSTQFRINGFIDRALSALTELLEDLVIPQGRANHGSSSN